MTDLLETAIALARTLPPERQDDLAHALLAYVEDDGGIIRLTPDEAADVAEGEAEAARNEFATDEEMRAVWAKFSR